jgi:glucose-1-phosphate thymidylyltransferase
MRALILAAGYATRLYPLTKDTPKSLLAIADKPMIDYIVEKLDDVDEIKEIIVVTNNTFHDKFRSWVKFCKHKKPIKIINDGTTSNEDRLGALKDIDYVVQQEMIKDDLMVIAGDNLFEFNIKDFINFFEKKKSPVLAVFDMKDKSKLAKKLGTVQLNEESKITDFEEKPESPKSTLAATACYIFQPEDVEDLDKFLKTNKKADNTGDFIAHLIQSKDVYGYAFDAGWFDIGSFDQLEEAYKRYESKQD